MELADLVAASAVVTATRSRTAKVAELARLLRVAAESGPRDVALVTAFLSGRVPHGRLGVGYRTITALPPPSETPSLTLADVDAAFTTLATAAAPGRPPCGVTRSTRCSPPPPPPSATSSPGW